MPCSAQRISQVMRSMGAGFFILGSMDRLLFLPSHHSHLAFFWVDASALEAKQTDRQGTCTPSTTVGPSDSE